MRILIKILSPFLPIIAFADHLSTQPSLFMEERLSIKDTIGVSRRSFIQDSLFLNKNEDLKLNEEAIKQIKFDFDPFEKEEHSTMKVSPINKPWMDFKVDLDVPTSMIDTTKVRKPEKYIRLLPYSIWTRFGEDPVFDVLVFGNKKRLEFTMQFDFDKHVEYAKTLLPNAGSFNPNPSVGGASFVIGGLDFIGFLYYNLNKHGRMLKHNRKHANAWKTYKDAPPALDGALYMPQDSTDIELVKKEIEHPGLYHNLKSLELIEYHTPKYFERPDNGVVNTNNASDRTTKKHRHRKQYVEKKQKDDIIKELPSNMEDLYKYIERKKQQDSIQRKELFRKDKVNQNVYEYEQQQRKLKERQN